MWDNKIVAPTCPPSLYHLLIRTRLLILNGYNNTVDKSTDIKTYWKCEYSRSMTKRGELHSLPTPQDERWTKLSTVEEIPGLQHAIEDFTTQSSFYLVETTGIRCSWSSIKKTGWKQLTNSYVRHCREDINCSTRSLDGSSNFRSEQLSCRPTVGAQLSFDQFLSTICRPPSIYRSGSPFARLPLYRQNELKNEVSRYPYAGFAHVRLDKVTSINEKPQVNSVKQPITSEFLFFVSLQLGFFSLRRVVSETNTRPTKLP